MLNERHDPCESLPSPEISFGVVRVEAKLKPRLLLIWYLRVQSDGVSLLASGFKAKWRIGADRATRAIITRRGLRSEYEVAIQWYSGNIHIFEA